MVISIKIVYITKIVYIKYPLAYGALIDKKLIPDFFYVRLALKRTI